jgi:site-specific DNA recombinase
VKDRKLVVNETAASVVRSIFERFVRIGSATTLARALAAAGIRTKRQRVTDRGYLYILLNNRTYIGEVVHMRVSYPGEHLQESPRKRAANTRGRSTPALLKGLLFGPNGLAFIPAYTRRGKKPYRYYVSTGVIKRGPEACTIRRVPAAEVERAVVDQVRALVLTPEIVVRTWKEAREHDRTVTEDQVRALGRTLSGGA